MFDIEVYVGGAKQDSGSGTPGSSPGSGAAVGGKSPSGSPFVGALDGVRVFKVARSAALIAADAVR